MDTGTIIALVSLILTALGFLTGIVIHLGKARKAKREKRSALKQKKRDLHSAVFEIRVDLESQLHKLARRKAYYDSLPTDDFEIAEMHSTHDAVEKVIQQYIAQVDSILEGLQNMHSPLDEQFMDELMAVLEQMKSANIAIGQDMLGDEKMFAVKIAEKNKGKSP